MENEKGRTGLARGAAPVSAVGGGARELRDFLKAGARVRSGGNGPSGNGRPGVARGPFSNNFLALSLTRAVADFNMKTPLSGGGTRLEILIDGDDFTLQAVRISDRAVIHRSRSLPLKAATAASARAIVDKFVKQDQSLAVFEPRG